MSSILLLYGQSRLGEIVKKKQSTTYKKIGLASVIMMVSVFSSRVIGLVREMCIAYVGGAGGGVDAYQVAFIIPEILNHVVASGFLSVTFIPIFSSYLTDGREEEGWRVFSIIFNTFGLFLLLLIVLAFQFSPQLVTWLAPGLTDPVRFHQAVKMTRIIMPAQFFFFSGGLFMAVQFTKEKFFLPALAPLIYNIGIIAGGIAGMIFLPKMGIGIDAAIPTNLNIEMDVSQITNIGAGMEGFAWGVLGGAFFGNFLVQYIGARRVGMKILPIINMKHPQFITYVLLTLPLMVGLTMTFSTEIFLKYFGSFLPEGSIAALNYALRIMFILVGIFGQAVGVASYPFMAKLAAKGKLSELNALLNTTLKFLALVIPVSVLFMVLRNEIVLLLFQRGRFDPDATRMTAQVLPFIMAGAIAFAAQTVVVRGYYAMQNTWFPALFGTVSVVVSLPIFFMGMKWMGASGVALALSISAMLNTGVLFMLWNRRASNDDARSLYRFFMKIVLISAGIGGILWWGYRFLLKILNHTGETVLLNPSTFTGALIISSCIGMLFITLFVLSGVVFKIDEIRIFMNKISSKIVSKFIRRI